MNIHDNTDYYSLSRLEVQNLVSPESKKILDVGCAEGKMASELKERNKAEVWGIEIVKDAAQKAQKKLDNVLIGPVEEQIPKLPEEYFDSIIFADVLEHLVNPEKVLKEIKSKLKDDGEIVVSLPNVRHWSVIVSLLDGSFDYADFGILDRTHLRFFTLKTASKMFANAGFEIKSLSASIVKFDIPKSLLVEFKNVGIKVDDLQEKSQHFQYLFRAVKKRDFTFLIDKDSTTENFKRAFLAIKEEDYLLADEYLAKCLRSAEFKPSSLIAKDEILKLQYKIKLFLKDQNVPVIDDE